MAGSQRSAGKRAYLLGQRRSEWIGDAAKSKLLTDADVRFLARMGWDFCDRRTGETRWSAERMAAEIGVSARQVLRYLANARAAGFLRQSVRPAEGRQAQHVMSFDYKDMAPAAPQPVRQQELPSWNDYTAALANRLNRARDDDAVRRIWDSPAERKRRAAVCGDEEWRADFLDQMREERLRDGQCGEF